MLYLNDFFLQRYFQEGLSTKTTFSQGGGSGDAEISKYAQTTNLQIEVTTFLHSQVSLSFFLSLFFLYGG